MSALGCDGPLVVLLDVVLSHIHSHVRCRVVFSCLCSPCGSYASCLICMSSFGGTKSRFCMLCYEKILAVVQLIWQTSLVVGRWILDI
jgi:hypothetical protein